MQKLVNNALKQHQLSQTQQIDTVTMLVKQLADNNIRIINHSKCSESVTNEVDERITQIVLNLS